jgi:hypothetical protein
VQQVGNPQTSFDPAHARNSSGKWSAGIVDSIETQMRARGKAPEEAHTLAIEIATNHGFLDAKGDLTALGKEREALGHTGRVIDRAARQLGHDPSEIGVQNGRPFVK